MENEEKDTEVMENTNADRQTELVTEESVAAEKPVMEEVVDAEAAAEKPVTAEAGVEKTVTTDAVAENNKEKKEKKPFLSTKKQKGIAAGILAAVLILAVSLGIYNLPANRVQRQLDLGYNYLAELNYEEAKVYFDKAIAIDDRNLEAYAGGLQAYMGLGNQEETAAFYEKALAAIAKAEETEITENLAFVADIYAAAETVYAQDLAKAVEVLEEGYGVTGQHEDVKQALANSYLKLAKEQEAEGLYEEALDVYKKALALGETKEALAARKDCLQAYLDLLMAKGDYDKIRALAKEYKDLVPEIDFDALLAEIAEIERIAAERAAFMQKVYDLMSAQDYEAMGQVDGSEEANAFVEQMESDRYIYLPDGNQTGTGTGAGVYKFGESGYYFFYGDLEGHKRVGNGVTYIKSGENFEYIFQGEWQEDLPNGAGTVKSYDTSNSGTSETVSTGTVVNGLWHGDVNVVFTTDGQDTYDLSFQAENGIPTEDKTEAFYRETGFSDVSHPENTYVYAYDNHLINSGAFSVISKDGKAGVYGFTE